MKKNLLRIGITWFFLIGLALSGSVARAALCSTCAFITGDDKIYAWDSSANTLSTVVVAPKGVLDSLVFDTNGNIIFDSDELQQVYSYNPTTQVTTLLATLDSDGNLGDIAVEPGGATILVAGRGNNKIYRINLTSKAVSTFFTGQHPDGIIFDNTGKLFVSLNNASVAQLDPITGAILKQIPNISGADGLTYSTTTSRLYVGSNNSGFYTIPSDLSSASFTGISGTIIDGVGTAGNYLYLVGYGTPGNGYKYDLINHTMVATTQPIQQSDDIAPLSGLGSPNPPPSISFTASPMTITSGSPSTLSWNIANAVTASIDQGIGSVSATSGTHSVSPTVTTTYTLSASGPGGNSTAQVTVTVSGIVTPPPPPPPTSTIQFNPTSYSVSENAGSAVITVTKTGDTTGTSTVQFASADGTATAGLDYLAVSGTLTFNPGDSSKTFQVPILLDRLVEGSETVNLSLSNVSGSNLGTSAATLTITDQSPTPPAAPNPLITELVPFSAPVDRVATFTLEVLGTGFDTTNSQVIWNGGTSLPVVSRSATEIDVTVNPSIWANTTGSYSVMVQNPGPANSNSALFTVYPTGSGNPPPFVTSGPTANPNPTYTQTTSLSAMGNTTSAGGESVLTYTWMLDGTNPATNVTFDNNGTHAGSSTTGTFPMAGTYHVKVRILDTVTHFAVDSKDVDVTVVRDPKSIVVAATSQYYTIGQSQALPVTATVNDQWNHPITSAVPSWSSSTGFLSPSGLSAAFTTADVNSEKVTVTAALTNALGNRISGSANIVVVVSGAGFGGDLGGAKAFPVPYKSNSGLPGITFTGLAPGSKIRLFTITGRIVQTLESPSGQDVLWDVKNADSKTVASGVYLYIIEGAGQKKNGKIVVIQ